MIEFFKVKAMMQIKVSALMLSQSKHDARLGQ